MALTTIADTLYLPDLSTASGTILVTPNLVGGWKAGDGKQLFAASLKIPITNDGHFTLSLEANDTALPAGTSYSAVFTIGALSWNERWVVPTSSSTLTLDAVRSVVTLGGGAVTAISGISDTKTTIRYDNSIFTVASISISTVLFTLPARCVVLGVVQKHSISFAPLDVTVQVGDGTTDNMSALALPFDISQAVDNQTAAFSGEFKNLTMASLPVIAVFSAPSNFGNGTTTNLTAGSVDINVVWKVLA